MSSIGTTICRSSRFSLGGETIVTGRAPPRNAATSPGGRTVADSPIRCAGRIVEVPVLATRGLLTVGLVTTGLGLARAERVKPLERQRQVRPPLAAGQRVYLVHDHGLDTSQALPCLRRQHEEQRFRRGDQDVRRLADELAPLVGGGVASPDSDPYVRFHKAEPPRCVPDAGQRRAEIPLDVHGQCLERRYVQDPAAPPGIGRRRLAASLSIAHRNAARVLPDPVGAMTRVWSPRAIELQACA